MSTRPKVLLNTYGRKIDHIFHPDDFARLEAIADLVWAKDEEAPAEVIEEVREDLFAMITGGWTYGDVGRFPNLKAILTSRGQFPTPSELDYAACFTRGVRVLCCASAYGPVVAEMALGLALCVARRIAWNDADFREGKGHWSHRESKGEYSIFGLQAGLIGFGSLGRGLKPLLEAFGCRIQVYDPWMTDAYLESQGVTPIDIDTLLSTSRLIFVLATPSSSNRAFLDREKLERILPGSAFILVSRSHVLDFDALTEFVSEGRFSAGIDVYPEEPVPKDHPIRRAPNVVFTPHRAGGNPEVYWHLGRMVANDLEALVQGLPPRELQPADPAYLELKGEP